MNAKICLLFYCIGSILAAVATPVSAAEVIPDFYRDPGRYPNRSYVNQSFNEYIDPFSGSLQHHYVDLHVPGNGGFDLKVIRSYNSAAIPDNNPSYQSTLAGLGWTVHFGRVLKSKDGYICLNQNSLSVADNPTLEMPDGSRDLLTFPGSSSPLMVTNQRWKADCISNGAGLAVYSPDGTRYDMTQAVNVGTATAPVYAWYTTKITDRNGNYATVFYAPGASPEITSVVTSDGRVLFFYYYDGGTPNRRISRIQGPEGQTYQYNYTPVGVAGRYFLSSVQRPDGTSWGYSYLGNLGMLAGSYLMRQATYPQGGAISYSYGFATFDVQQGHSTVVAGKSLSTGGSWSFSYTPGNYGVYDTTTVYSPAGTTVYQHIGPNYSISGGSVWMVGLLVSKQIGNAQTETYTWTKQKLSSETYFRPGAFVTKVDVGETNAPVLTQKKIVRDGATYLTTYSNFDGFGNPGLVSESGPNGGNRATSLTYYTNVSKWIVKQAQNESFSGGNISRSFDGNGNLTSISQDNVTTSYAYDTQGNIISAVFPRGLIHGYANYRRGMPQAESQPEGVTIARVVSDSGNVTSETNGEGWATSYRYDGLNRVIAIGYPVGNGVSIAYGMNSKTASRGGLSESTSYDGFGNPASISLGGITKSYSYDALGRKTFESDPSRGTGTSYQYDILDRVTRATHPDNSYRAISYGLGTVTVTDERGKTTVQTYRSYGDPTQQFVMSVAAPEPTASITLSRNAKDMVTSVTQGGLTRGYIYDASYRLVSETNPETGQTSYGRDAAGNMISRTVGTSGTTSYVYDGQNRLVKATYPGSTPAVTHTYSRTGKLKQVSSSVATRSYAYDGNDNLMSEALAIDGLTLAVGYGYNGNDQLSSITYPRSGRTVSYVPDTLGRPTQVSGYVNSVLYWPSGQIQQINYANGTLSLYDQNIRLWPASFNTFKGSAVYLASTYTYDGAGNLTAISDGTDSSYNRALFYDNIGRLSNISGPWGSGIVSYSSTGNILSQSLGSYGTLFYSYDGMNRLASVSGNRATSFGYDAYGNVTYGWSSTYTYDGVPNLRCVNCSTASYRIDYAYDGMNRRVAVTKAGVKTYEVYGSNGNLLAEFAPAQGNRLVEYIYLGGKRIAQRVSTQ
ncbi:MAG: hypothetical protein PHU46_01175 [Rhodocyclaceae bacterium]|nr:hypothetical protein [Rhodocyclaceae bacterium]